MQKLLVLVVLLGFSLPMVAQDYSKVDVFGGYQYSHLASSISPVAGANGWDGSLTFNITPEIGITGDFNGAYQTVSGSYIGVSGNFPGHYYSFAGGPVFSFNSRGMVKPFVHVLFGGARVSSSATASGVTVTASSTGFTTLFGGGVDLRLTKHVALRLVQGDWVYYHFGSIGSLTSTSSSGNFKIASGIVISFGGK